jgi:hypothetical protein
MNDPDDIKFVAVEIADLARLRGIILDTDGVFALKERTIFFWRKDSAVHYNLQGKVTLLPDKFHDSIGKFRGGYHEVGTVLNMEAAVDLVIAWITDRREVRDLPTRAVRSSGIP